MLFFFNLGEGAKFLKQWLAGLVAQQFPLKTN